MRILYVTPYVPSLIRTRPYNLIRALIHLGHQVTLLTATGTSSEEREQADALRQYGVQVETFPVSRWRSLRNCLSALPTREPLQAVYAYHPGLENRLVCLLQEQAFDVVHIEHLRAARLARTVKGVPKVYDAVDCISLLFEQTAQGAAQVRSRLMSMVDLARTRRYEAQLLTRYDQVVITSRRDKEALENLARRYLPREARRAPIAVVTNGVDLDYFRPREHAGQEDGHIVVFTGKMSYHANVAGALYFAREVLPRIWAKAPQVQFQIVGQDPPKIIRRLAVDQRIQVTGTVDDLRPYLAQATVAVCPVHYAVGIQNKVLEAMAMGKPVVCTPAAFAGLSGEKGKEALVADDPEEFTAQVLRVCSDSALARRLAAAGRRYVENYHSWETSARHLLEAYEQARLAIRDASDELLTTHPNQEEK